MKELAADNFLDIAKQFQLGHLLTESTHPLTTNLSELVKTDLSSAIEVLKEVDLKALKTLKESIHNLRDLAVSIEETFKSGNRVFLCGCGATGRLSLALETIWRREDLNFKYQNQVISFMAGGDVALINSIEKFEDYPEYGERQLFELGYNKDDLLIGCSEGGETPFVIGAIKAAAKVSSRSPYFLYCNPDEQLVELSRSKDLIESDQISTVSLPIGPMAIAGSTRMQASTVLMLSVGISLWSTFTSFEEQVTLLDGLIEFFENISLAGFEKLISHEASFFNKGEFVTYESDSIFGLTVLTDTTERSPTFSLTPFDRVADKQRDMSFNYLLVHEVSTSQLQWHHLLAREPRLLEWDGFEGIASSERLKGFDFSVSGNKNRKELIETEVHHFVVRKITEGFSLELDGDLYICRHNLSPLFEQVVLKMLLNIHSTLVMGLLDRYTSNIMTWVRPSNFKLIDRVVRYVQLLLKRNGDITTTYEEIVKICYKLIDERYDGPIVLEIYKILKIGK